MPTYEYECRRCGHRFELLQSITASTTIACPKCPGKAKRLIGSGAGIIFKGSGFYATDYKKDSNKDRQKKKDSPASGCPINKDCKECQAPKE